MALPNGIDYGDVRAAIYGVDPRSCRSREEFEYKIRRAQESFMMPPSRLMAAPTVATAKPKQFNVKLLLASRR